MIDIYEEYLFVIPLLITLPQLQNSAKVTSPFHLSPLNRIKDIPRETNGIVSPGNWASFIKSYSVCLFKIFWWTRSRLKQDCMLLEHTNNDQSWILASCISLVHKVMFFLFIGLFSSRFKEKRAEPEIKTFMMSLQTETWSLKSFKASKPGTGSKVTLNNG